MGLMETNRVVHMVTDGNGNINGIVMEWVGYPFGNGNDKLIYIWIFLDVAVDARPNVNTHNGK